MNKKPDREVRKSCAILGLSPEGLSKKAVIKSWRTQLLTVDSIDPALGSELEASSILSKAKNVLLAWIDDEDPDPDAPSGVAKNPTPNPPMDTELEIDTDENRQIS